MTPPNDSTDTQGLPAFVTDPLGVLLRRWRWMLAALVLGLAATGAATLLLPTTYIANVSVLVGDQQIPEEFVPDTTGEEGVGGVDALVGEVMSRERLAPIIEKNRLFADARRPLAEVIGLMHQRVEISPSTPSPPRRGAESSSIYTISFEYEQPQVAADVANDIASLFMAAASRSRGRQAQLTLDFMRAELARSERELRAQEALVTDFKQQNRGELPSELGTNSARLERLASLRQTLVQQITASEARVERLRELGDLQDPASPEARLTALRERLATELAVNTDEHPNVVSLRRMIASLEAEVGKNGASGAAVRESERELADLRGRLSRAEQEAALLEERVARTPLAEEKLAALEQRLGVLRDTYVSNLRKVEAAELAKSVESAQQGARVEVLDRALPPRDPVRSPLLVALAGVALSFAVALAVGVLLELVDPVIVSAAQAEETLQLTVLGSVGRIG